MARVCLNIGYPMIQWFRAIFPFVASNSWRKQRPGHLSPGPKTWKIQVEKGEVHPGFPEIFARELT